MNYGRRYVQFENLVFDEVGMVSEDTTSARFKTFSSEYSFRHGSYSPHKRSYKLLAAGTVSLTITLKMKKLPCDVRPFYPRFAKAELSKAVGRLWAVQNNELLWAWAEPHSYRESVDNLTDSLEFDINFNLPEGLWHKADKLRTFLVPYDPCSFMDCYEFKEINPCANANGDCCGNCGPEPIGVCDCCDNTCDNVSEENALCFFPDLSSFTDCDPAGYKIVVDCEAAERYFGSDLGNAQLGQRFCAECGSLIIGRLYSNTDIPTRNIRIRITGEALHNPYIEINGNGNIIDGDYKGTLEIHPDGTVYSYDGDCGPCTPLPVTRWVIPDGMQYGWEVHQGYNRLKIDPGTCCYVCAWIETDELTF